MLPEPDRFKALPGRGVEAAVLGYDVHIGNMAWMEACGVDLAGEGTARQLQQDLEERVRHRIEAFSIFFNAFPIKILLLSASCTGSDMLLP